MPAASRPARVRRALTAAMLALAVAACTPPAPPDPPAGLGAIALDARVGLAWKASPGATSYALYRGTSPTTITTRVTPSGFTGTSFTDTTAVNGQTYYYAVRASSGGPESGSTQLAQATPRARSCASGNTVVVENCFPGTTAWKTPQGVRRFDGGVEGYASSSSIDAGESVDIRTTIDSGVPYRIEVYRTGHYGGSQGRLVSIIPGLSGAAPPGCLYEPTTTGVEDCAGWSVSATLTTTAAWPSGTYLLKLVREDNGNASELPLVVRDDGSNSDVLYGVPTSTYQAYNLFQRKSLYDGPSDPPNTVSGGHRAVKVSYDRPYSQPTHTSAAHDWYSRTDVATVSWLEQRGYDVTYVASEDLHTNGSQLQNHDVFVSGSHDEYWTTQMYDAAIAARNSGTSLFFMGANAVYWRIRYEASTVSGRSNRVVVTYKTIQGGPEDPSGSSTSTWRDPAGPNRPENQLIGQMYVGDNSSQNFPLRVSAAEGAHRVWRGTSVASLPPGTFVDIGQQLVGWEWDARVSNGREPAGVETVASTPVDGGLIQDNGRFQTPGAATANATIYTHASGAIVFATGTNNWWRGLARNVHNEGEPDARIRQATANVLADMGATP